MRVPVIAAPVARVFSVCSEPNTNWVHPSLSDPHLSVSQFDRLMDWTRTGPPLPYLYWNRVPRRIEPEEDIFKILGTSTSEEQTARYNFDYAYRRFDKREVAEGKKDHWIFFQFNPYLAYEVFVEPIKFIWKSQTKTLHFRDPRSGTDRIIPNIPEENDVYQWVGAQWRAQFRADLNRVPHLFSGPIELYLQQFRHWMVECPRSRNGHEGETFILHAGSEPERLLKVFRHPWNFNDQVRCLLRLAVQLADDGETRIRVVGIHTLGRNFMIREYLQPEQLRITRAHLPFIKALYEDYEETRDQTYQILADALEVLINVLENRETVENFGIERGPDGRTRLVLYDPT